jgi:Na+/proline symporter/nitrogen-specific signal transduction histidine kinase
LAVYCTAWTFYGSVGLAVGSGLGFLTIYIGPTLMALLGWSVWQKIIRISKVHRITSIADFIASRYGKSTTLGGLATNIAVIGVIPYIALQLKAISTGFLLVTQYPEVSVSFSFSDVPIMYDPAFYIALLLAIFAILFGTRHLDATERHEGLVAAIAFESIVKLAAFLTVGIFVTYFIHNGLGDLFQKAAEYADTQKVLEGESNTSAGALIFDQYLTIKDQGFSYTDWSIYLLISMLAIIFLPRQFQIAVVENVNEAHLNKAIWLFPLYLLAINIFVLPVAFSGVLRFPDGSVDADTFVLTLPMAERQQLIALFVYLGGMSAATGMVIVETIALSTMICNDLVMPVLLRLPIEEMGLREDYSGLLLTIRRCSIVLVLLLGYAYFRTIGEFFTLVSIGLVSFVAVAQFAPALLGGIFWKGGSRTGAICGLLAGFAVWFYTLFLPSLVPAGIISEDFISRGFLGIELLKPFELFGLQGFNRISHAVFWSLLVNTGAYIGVSILSRPRTIEHTQAALFVDVFRYSGQAAESHFWRGTAHLPDLKSLLIRFLGRKRTDEALADYADKRKLSWNYLVTADANLVSYAERLLAGAIGSASARVMVASVVKEESLGFEEVLNILDETRQVIAYSRELEKATAELQEANRRLKDLDRLKDEFISTVTHELRTPLTSVRSLAEILHTNPDIGADQHKSFTGIIIKESERLTRLINQVLDYEKIESAQMDWVIVETDIKEVIQDAVSSTHQLIEDKDITIEYELTDNPPLISGDRDRLVQVMVNLISNAVKFCDSDRGKITIRLTASEQQIQVDVQDNGIGIRTRDQDKIFEKFQQIKDPARGRPYGTGIGLTISKRIIDFHHGNIWVNSKPGEGSTFSFTLPTSRETALTS